MGVGGSSVGVGVGVGGSNAKAGLTVAVGSAGTGVTVDGMDVGSGCGGPISPAAASPPMSPVSATMTPAVAVRIPGSVVQKDF